MRKIIILGASGHAKVTIDIIEQNQKFQIIGLIDNHMTAGEMLSGYKVLGNDSYIGELIKRNAAQGYIVAIGDNALRAKVTGRISADYPDLELMSFIHPNTSVAPDVSVGAGTVIMAGAVVNPACTIGCGCIVNSHASLDHDSILNDFSSLAPGVVIGGSCNIGKCSAIGIGATLRQGINIGEHSVIGAGSTVLRDIGTNKVAFGSPADEVRERKVGENYL